MARKIVSADTLEGSKKKDSKKSKSNIDLEKVKDFVSDNKDTIGKIATLAGSLFVAKKASQKAKSKKTTKRSTKKKTTSNNTDVTDLIGKLFK